MSTAPGGAAIGATLLYCEKFALPAVVSPDTSSAVSLHVLFGVPPGLAGPVCVVRSGALARRAPQPRRRLRTAARVLVAAGDRLGYRDKGVFVHLFLRSF